MTHAVCIRKSHQFEFECFAFELTKTEGRLKREFLIEILHLGELWRWKLVVLRRTVIRNG